MDAPRRARLVVLALGMAFAGGTAQARDAAAVAPFVPQPATPADCDAAASWRVLQPGDASLGGAAAVWLDADTLRWPGKGPGARLRLLSTDGVFARLAPGDPLPADAVRGWRLTPAMPESGAPPRAAWTGAGADWRVADPGWRDASSAADVVLAEVDARDRIVAVTRVQHALALDARYAAAATVADYGVRLDGDAAAFRVWAPTADAAWVCVHPDDRAPATALVPMARDRATGTWSARHDGARGGFYTYLVDVPVPGVGRVRNRVTDPYATSLGADSRRAWIGSPDDPATFPAGWDTAPRGRSLAHPTDAILYELHVRDFSIGDATVPAAHRGRYLAFGEDASDGMRHLRALADAGVTDVHLLPVYDFGSVPETGCATPVLPTGTGDAEAVQAAVAAVKEADCFNWGYDPVHYGVPEGSYAGDPHDAAARLREFRAMVMALHRAGLRVGMDVVYNHTFASGQHEKSVLDRLVPGYYHRLDATGAVERSTCCDNTATEHAMMAKLMIDTAVAWVRDYRIDSFRFDLMGHQPRAAMETLQRAVDAAAGRPVLLIGEGWNFGEIADGKRFVQASQRSLGGSGIGTFSDRARDAVRGGGCCDSGTALAANQGWVNGLHHAPNGMNKTTPEQLQRAADLLRVGLAGTLADLALETHDGTTRRLAAIDYAGQPAGYVQAPGEVVNYVENHDNLTLWDVNALKLPRGTPAAERARVQVLALATVALSQGIAYFHAGGEILRSKSLDRNSFNSGDAFNRIDWTLRDNGFGIGLPPAEDNAASWDVMRAALADPTARPSPADIRWARDAFLDLVRLRAATPLLRLRDAEAVRARLRFVPAGKGADGRVVGAWLDGDGIGDGRDVAYFLNAATTPADVVVPALAGRAFGLHPVQSAASAADDRPRREARYDAATGAFRVPPRTAVVFVSD